MMVLLMFPANLLDPTISEVRQVVANDIARLREWGFQLIKHDFSTVDIADRWGREMHDGSVTEDGWSFQSRKQTTAEIINDFYATIRKAAADDVVVLGCNTMSHLTAGVFEVNRIGDDSSGNEWHRIRPGLFCYHRACWGWASGRRRPRLCCRWCRCRNPLGRQQRVSSVAEFPIRINPLPLGRSLVRCDAGIA
jgi:hypothetical protein